MEDATPPKEKSNEWVLIIGGIISIIFGVVLVAKARMRRKGSCGNSVHGLYLTN
jgi:hypothetical protein